MAVEPGITKVLIVDGEEENLHALEQILDGLDITLTKATTGNDALRECLNHDFAALILNMELPDMDGYEVAKFVHEEEKTKHFPIIFVTPTHPDAYHEFKGYKAGALDYITTPINKQILHSKMRVLMELYQKRLEMVEKNRMLKEEIEKRKLIEEELRRLTGELMRSNRELELFAYTASHDLKEPLRKVTVFADRLRKHLNGKLDEKAEDYLERMEGASKRMKELIDGLLELSRITTRAEPFKKVDLAEVLVGIQSDMEVSISRAGADIIVCNLPSIEAEPLQMRQLFSNMLANALKFCNESPRILIKSRPVEKQAYQITIEDNGIGFEEKFLNVIFEPFQRLHPRGEYAGVGMGLAICHRIVSRHGGTITAKSTPGKGACFIITLPARQDRSSFSTGS